MYQKENSISKKKKYSLWLLLASFVLFFGGIAAYEYDSVSLEAGLASLVKGKSEKEELLKVIGASGKMNPEEAEEKKNQYLSNCGQFIITDGIIYAKEGCQTANCRIINKEGSGVGLVLYIINEHGIEIYRSKLIEEGLGISQFTLEKNPVAGNYSSMMCFDLYNCQEDKDIFLGTIGRAVKLMVGKEGDGNS